MPKKPYLSVIIPSYNEVANIKRNVLDEVYDYLKNQSYDFEIILSDDGSTDGTTKLLEEFAKKYLEVKLLVNQHAGKAPTVKAGMLAANGEWQLFTDFDQSTPISEIEKLLTFGNTHQVVIGSRELPGASRDKEPIHRHLMGKAFNFIVQILAVPGILDTQCGFKLFSAEASEKLFSKLYVYGISKKRKDAFTGACDVELLYLAKKFNFKIKEVPIIWKHYHSARVNPIKDSWRMFKDIIKIRLADLSNKY